MDIKQIRKENLLALIGDGSNVAFAGKVGTNPAYISQILSTKTKANVGDEMARSIEQAFGLEYGWMDNPHTEAKADAPPEIIAAWELLTQEQRQDFTGKIKDQAATNKAILEQLAPHGVVNRTHSAQGGVNLSSNSNKHARRKNDD